MTTAELIDLACEEFYDPSHGAATHHGWSVMPDEAKAEAEARTRMYHAFLVILGNLDKLADEPPTTGKEKT